MIVQQKSFLLHTVSFISKLLILFLLVYNAQIQAVTILEDFEDGNNNTPYYWAVATAPGCSAIFEADSGAGYGGSIYAGHGNYYILQNNKYASFIGMNFYNSFGGDGIILYARGNGIWHISAITTEMDPNTAPYVKIKIDSLWRPYYFRWQDFSYPPRAVNRPEIIPSHIHSLTFNPQRQQAGKSEDFWLDNIGYFSADSAGPGDIDGDGIPNESDLDADNDGWFNILERYAGCDSLDSNYYPASEVGLPSAGAYTGIFPIMYWGDEVFDFERFTGLKSALMTLYTGGWGDTLNFYHFDRAGCDFIARSGAIPVYQWPILNSTIDRQKFWLSIMDSTYRLQKIINGDFDGELFTFATEVKNWKMPIILNPAIEYNQGFAPYHGIANFGPLGKSIPPRSLLGNIGTSWIGDSLIAYCDTVPAESISNYYGYPNIPDGPERLRDALIHIKSVFNSAGANNIIWTMQAHPIVDPAHCGSWTNLSNYYADGYVDWHSMSAHHGVINDTLRTLSYIITACYDSLLMLNPAKPIIAIEFAVHSDSTGIMDMTNIFVSDFTDEFPNNFPMVKGWTYVNSDLYGTDYENVGLQIDSSRYSGEINTFCALAQNPYYIKEPILFPNSPRMEKKQSELNSVKLECYPNPSNFVINIKYSIGIVCGVELKIYNVTGQLVKTLINEKQAAGNYVVNWNGKDNYGENLPTGVYFVKLRTGGFEQINKLILLR